MIREFDRILRRGVLSGHEKKSLPPEEKIRLVDEFGREQERTVGELPDAHEAAMEFVMELAKNNPDISVGKLSETGRPLVSVLEKILGDEGIESTDGSPATGSAAVRPRSRRSGKVREEPDHRASR